MTAVEIVVIVLSVLIVVSVIGFNLYLKHKHLPNGDCACCCSNMRKLIKQHNKRKI